MAVWRFGRFVGLVRIWTKIGRFCGPKANMKHLKHPKHLKHLKHLMWMPGLLFCKHFKELGGKIKDGVHKRQDQKGMLLFPSWIDAIDPIDWIDSIGWMRYLMGLPQPTLRGSYHFFGFLQAALQTTPSLTWRLAVTMPGWLSSGFNFYDNNEVYVWSDPRRGQFNGGVPENQKPIFFIWFTKWISRRRE